MIFISAGHYPAAPGAKWADFVEHDEAMVWATSLTAELADRGMESTLVPTGILKDKAAFINEQAVVSDAAVEIHFNAARNAAGEPVGRGCETLYYPGSERGLALATACQEALSGIFPPDRGVKEGWYRMDKTKGPDFFLARTRCAAVIIEPEFVHRFENIHAHRIQGILALADALKDFMAE